MVAELAVGPPWQRPKRSRPREAFTLKWMPWRLFFFGRLTPKRGDTATARVPVQRPMIRQLSMKVKPAADLARSTLTADLSSVLPRASYC